MTQRQPEYEFDLTGGQLALNLANTVSRRADPERRKEHLENYGDLVAFAKQSGIISLKQATELCDYAQRHGREAVRSFRKAIALREVLYRAFSAISQSKTATADDLSLINDFAIEALRHRCLSRSNGGYRWEWRPDRKNPLDRVLWAAAQAAANLLTSSELQLVRYCEAPDCEWLFLDYSRNRSRRWCDMTTCGNRQKARRHYQRTHQ
ncbi:MAG: ABATE domain-containing protein [Candidatus Korobacteraceae bacterium]